MTFVIFFFFSISGQMEEFANFDFNIWRKRYIQWISHLKSRILDVFRSIDRDQDGRITQKEFVDYVLASSKYLLVKKSFQCFHPYIPHFISAKFKTQHLKSP